jgi:Na+/melibiose symporter-like transporter
MRPIKEILRSPGFMREVSILLFGFAAIGGLFFVVLLGSGKTDIDTLSILVALLVQTIIYVVLGILIRRGSVKALWAAGILFTLDTLLIFVFPDGNLGMMILVRGFLIFLLVRYVRRRRSISDEGL